MAEDLLGDTQPVFAQARELRESERQRGVVAERAEVAEVRGDPLALEQQRAQPPRALGDGCAGGGFERHAVGPRVGDRRIARHAAGEPMPVERRELGESLLDPLVRVAEPFLEAQHLLADDREPEVTGLDDARMHRPDRNLVDTVAGDANEGIVDDRSGGEAGARDRVIEQGQVVARPRAVVQPRPGVARPDRDDPEQVRRGALHPRGAGKVRRHVGIRWRVGGQREVEPDEPLGQRVGRARGEAAGVVPAAVRAPERDQTAVRRCDRARRDLPRIGVDARAPDRQRRRQAFEVELESGDPHGQPPSIRAACVYQPIRYGGT
jgi:hypothetical protein